MWPAGDERRERRPELARERAVEHVEQRRGGAEVVREAAHRRRGEPGPPLAEDVDVGVTEPVDRLQLVADGEQVVALERLQHVELQAIRVLELVDHDQREPLGPGPPRAVVREQVAHAQLEVREVDPGTRRLGGLVLAAEAVQEIVEQHERLARVVVGARRPVRLPRLAIGDAGGLVQRLRAAGQPRGIERPRPRQARRRRAARARRAPRGPPTPSCRRRRRRAPQPRRPEPPGAPREPLRPPRARARRRGGVGSRGRDWPRLRSAS